MLKKSVFFKNGGNVKVTVTVQRNITCGNTKGHFAGQRQRDVGGCPPSKLIALFSNPLWLSMVTEPRCYNVDDSLYR